MSASNRMKNIPVIVIAAALLFSLAVRAQDKNPDSKGKADSSSNSVHLTIVVTTAEDKKPVELTCRLVSGPEALSETWTYTWAP